VRDVGGELRRVALDRGEGRLVALVAREFEELLRVAQAAVKRGQAADDRVELLLFLAEILGAPRVVPDLGVLERLGDRL
jgi:alkylhydroperoxidase/carboxymuconolactone decarboxylase family protein YurZ